MIAELQFLLALAEQVFQVYFTRCRIYFIEILLQVIDVGLRHICSVRFGKMLSLCNAMYLESYVEIHIL